MHMIYCKLWLETLAAEEHHTGTEAVRSQNKFVNEQPSRPMTSTAVGSPFEFPDQITNFNTGIQDLIKTVSTCQHNACTCICSYSA